MSDQAREMKAFEEGALVAVSVGKKSWKMTLTPKDFGLDEFPKNFEPGRRRLLPDDALNRIDYLEGQARRAADKFSFNFGLAKTRVKHRWVQLSKLGLVLVTLDEIKENYFTAVTQLIEKYEEHKARMKADFPDQWPFLEKAYIAKESIQDEYYFEYEVINMVFPSQMSAVKKFELQQADLAVLDRTKAEQMTQADLAQMRRDHQERLERILRQQQEMAVSRAEQFVENAVKQLRGKVVEVFEQITGKIKDGKSIIKTNLDTIRATLHDVRQLDFIGDDAAFHAQLDRVQALIDSGKEFRDDAAAVRELNAALTGAVTHINTTDAEAITKAKKTYFGRRLNLAA